MAKIIAVLLAAALALILARGLRQRDRCEDSRISFDDLLLDPDGRMSKSAIVMFGSFAVTTWMMVFLTLVDKMSEGYLTIYGGLWIIPAVTKLIKGTAPAPEPVPPALPTD